MDDLIKKLNNDWFAEFAECHKQLEAAKAYIKEQNEKIYQQQLVLQLLRQAANEDKKDYWDEYLSK